LIPSTTCPLVIIGRGRLSFPKVVHFPCPTVESATAAYWEGRIPAPMSSTTEAKRAPGWIDAMRPMINGPLLIIGVVGILAAGRRWADEDLARVPLRRGP
jgi:hypothetical protein